MNQDFKIIYNKIYVIFNNSKDVMLQLRLIASICTENIVSSRRASLSLKLSYKRINTFDSILINVIQHSYSWSLLIFSKVYEKYSSTDCNFILIIWYYINPQQHCFQKRKITNTALFKVKMLVYNSIGASKKFKVILYYFSKMHFVYTL